jgi:hypothetical protein
MQKGFTKHSWRAPAGYRFDLTLSQSSYLVEIYKCAARTGEETLIDHSGRGARRPQWGPSLTDSLNSACYSGDPSRALGGIGFLFNRIDKGFEGDRTLYQDLFADSQYVGETGKQRHERWQPYRDAEKRAQELRFGGGWNEAKAEAERIRAELERQDADIDAQKAATVAGEKLARVVITSPSGETTFGPFVDPDRAADDAAALTRMFGKSEWKHRLEYWHAQAEAA